MDSTVAPSACRAAAGGGTAAFEDYVAARRPALLRFGRLLSGNTAAAEDLVQTALARSYLRWGSIDDPEAYVRRAMVNANLSWWRRRPWREELTDTLPERAADGPGAEVGVDLRDAVWTALAGLPARQRSVLVLRYYEGLTEREIADLLHCSVGTVKSAASRALDKLRALPELKDESPRPASRSTEGEA